MKNSKPFINNKYSIQQVLVVCNLFFLVLLSSCSKSTEIKYSPENWEKIHSDVKRYKYKGYIDSKTLQEAEGTLIENSEEFPVKTRIKGDWTDHIKGKKWSQRVKGTEPPYWKNMQAFSIMDPKMRNYWKEWLYHKLLQKADVLTTQYFFKRISVAEKQVGFFAVEEHFTETLLKNAGRPDGPILRLDEDHFFDHLVKQWSAEKKSEMPHIAAAQIKVYQKKRWKKNGETLQTYKSAKQKLFQYQHQTEGIDSLLDIDKWARFYAIVDLCKAYHSLAWHNMRYYFNPESKLLEPVGYDGNGPTGETELWSKKATLIPIEDSVVYWGNMLNFNTQLFKNQSFLTQYKEYANLYSKKEWYQPIFAEMYNYYKDYEYSVELNCNDTLYEFWLDRNAKNIKTDISTSKKWNSKFVNFNLVYPKFQTSDFKFYQDAMITENYDKTSKTLEIINFHPGPIIYSYKIGKKLIQYTIAAYQPPKLSTASLKVPKKTNIKYTPLVQ